jgi:hypothetical protein
MSQRDLGLKPDPSLPKRSRIHLLRAMDSFDLAELANNSAMIIR